MDIANNIPRSDPQQRPELDSLLLSVEEWMGYRSPAPRSIASSPPNPMDRDEPPPSPLSITSRPDTISATPKLGPGLEKMELREGSGSPMLGLTPVNEEEEIVAMLFGSDIDGYVWGGREREGSGVFGMDIDDTPIEKQPLEVSLSYFDGPASVPEPADNFGQIKRRYTDGMQPPPDWQVQDVPSFDSLSGSLDLFSQQQQQQQQQLVSPPSADDNVAPQDPIVRRTSSKRRRHGWRPASLGKNQMCTCVLPDRPKSGQRLFLDKLPTEILLDIFEFAFMSPVTPPKCEHQKQAPAATSPGVSISRRATENSFFLQPLANARNNNPTSHTFSSHSPTSGAPSTSESPVAPMEDRDEPLELSESLRIFRAKTLFNITLTCRSFYEILCEDPGTDLKLWRSAARWCWDWLPPNLPDVQGHNLSSQTSWRNLVAVFMRSENGLFGKKGGGRGGVESFGGKKRGIQAITWQEWKQRRHEQPRRKLMLVCAQPGPDIFTATTNPDSHSWTISMSLRGGVDYFVHLDEYGRFSRGPGRLPGGLKRPSRGVGYFPSDIFEVEGDRMQLVKVALRKGARHEDIQSMRKPLVEEVVTWDLSVVPEYVSDPKACVARCISHGNTLFFNLFTHGDLDPLSLEFMLDPPEDPRMFCIEAIPSNGTSTPISAKAAGKQPALSCAGTTTRYLWQHTPTYSDAALYPASKHLHPLICSLALNATYAVALVRWNIRTPQSPEELVARSFQILCTRTGRLLGEAPFPNLFWDYRHHDMSASYNLMRHKKLSRLYNHLGPAESIGAGNRATRVHADQFYLTETYIVSGSHDYCNWIWPLPPAPQPVFGVYTATHNDAGREDTDPFRVLDDYYWAGADGGAGKWTTTAERAGWWVRTPNQVLCYWHALALSPDARHFAACRPGKLFLWDLDSGCPNDTVRGYTSITPTPTSTSTPSTSLNNHSHSHSHSHNPPPPPPPPSSSSTSMIKDNKKLHHHRQHWLGKLAPHARKLQHRVKTWFVCDNVLPSQGLWLVFDNGDTIFLDRDDILEAAGARKSWVFGERDFWFDDEAEAEGGGGDEEDDDDEEEEDEEMEWSDTEGEGEYEDEERGVPKKIRLTETRDEWWDELDKMACVGNEEAFRFEAEGDVDEVLDMSSL